MSHDAAVAYVSPSIEPPPWLQNWRRWRRCRSAWTRSSSWGSAARDGTITRSPPRRRSASPSITAATRTGRSGCPGSTCSSPPTGPTTVSKAAPFLSPEWLVGPPREWLGGGDGWSLALLLGRRLLGSANRPTEILPQSDT